jgi:hypothetical protein
MVKSKPNNRAMGARRARRGPRKNIQKQNQKASRVRAAPNRQGVSLAKVSARMPTRMYQEGDAFVVEHDEYVADIYSDVGNVFAYEVYELNPGNSQTYPWLSNIALRYEEFEAVELAPHFETAAPTTASGKVILAIDFDPADDTGSGTKQELLNDDRTKSGPLWQNFTQSIDRGKLHKRLFVTNNIDTTPGDSGDQALLRQQDIGNLFVATTATSLGGGAMIGELWIRSKIKFFTPILHVPALLGSVDSGETQYTTTSGITDVLRNLAIVANASTVPPLISGISIGRADESALQLPGGNWAFITSGTAVPDSTGLIKFLADWAGTVVLEVKETGGTTALPDFGSLLVVASQFGRTPGSVVAGPSYTDQIQVAVDAETISTVTSGLFTGVSRAFLDIAAMAGTAISVTCPTFSPNTNVIRELHMFPTSAGFPAYRKQLMARLSGKTLPAPRPMLQRPVLKTYKRTDEGSSSSTSTV